MLERWKRQWDEFKRLKPGKRFQTQHERHRKSAAGKSPVRRAASIVAAVICLAIGVVLAFIPGPAIVFFLIAGGLFAMQSRSVARALDFCEVRLRRAAAAVRQGWQRHFHSPQQAGRN